MSKLSKAVGAAALCVLPASQAFATSTLNANFRLFEDTISLVAFVIMMVAGFKCAGMAGAAGRSGYLTLGIAGVVGVIWKGVGVVKRVTTLNEPVWLFEIVRETAEGLSGIVLAVACLLLVTGLRKLYGGRSSSRSTGGGSRATSAPNRARAS